MANDDLRNRLREERAGRGWSQEELAARAGLSRAEVSAIETGRVAPSTVAALSLAAVLGCRVEDLFRLGGSRRSSIEWAWAPGREPRYWLAAVGGRLLRYPVEPTAAGVVAHDGVSTGGGGRDADPGRTLVVAGCDPAVGLLADAVWRASGVRVLPLVRSSRRALALLGAGRVHMAGLHLGGGPSGPGNGAVVRSELGPGYRLVRVAGWREGLVLARGLGHRTLGEALRAPLRWVGREEGSGARRLMDELLADRRPEPEGLDRLATDHRGVVETIRTGWAQAGVCVELAAAEGGLDFLAAEEEDYDLCFRAEEERDPRLAAVLDVLRARSFARLLAGLPGYDARRTGELS